MSSMTPPPGMNGGAPAPAPGAPPSQAPASPEMVLLSQMYQLARKLADQYPQMSSGMEKVTQGIQEAQTAMLTQAPGPGPEQNPPV